MLRVIDERTVRIATVTQWVNSIPPLMTTREIEKEGKSFNNPSP